MWRFPTARASPAASPRGGPFRPGGPAPAMSGPRAPNGRARAWSRSSMPTRRPASRAPRRCRPDRAPTPGCAMRPIRTGSMATMPGRRRSRPRSRRDETRQHGDAPDRLPTGSSRAMSDAMSGPARGKAVDCDVHPAVPGMQALLPYLDDHWRTSVQERGIDSLDSISYPPNAPLSARPDWRDPSGRAGTGVAALGAQVLDRWGSGCAILNCLYGVQLVFNEDMAAAFARAVNGWIAAEWLRPAPRPRAPMGGAPP